MSFEEIIQQHKYCFICKGNLIIKGFNYSQCESCGYRNFINPAPTSGAILTNSQGEILLVVRAVDPGKGLLDIPGGFIDIGENAEDGVARELKEELGIEIKELKYFGSFPGTYVFDGIKIVTVGFIYTGKIDEQKIIPSDDVSAYKFFKPLEIPFEETAFEELRAAIKKYISTL